MAKTRLTAKDSYSFIREDRDKIMEFIMKMIESPIETLPKDILIEYAEEIEGLAGCMKAEIEEMEDI